MLCLFYVRNIVHRIPSLNMFLFFSFGILIFFRFGFVSMYYTDLCNVLAMYVQIYLMPNNMSCYVMSCSFVTVYWYDVYLYTLV